MPASSVLGPNVPLSHASWHLEAVVARPTQLALLKTRCLRSIQASGMIRVLAGATCGDVDPLAYILAEDTDLRCRHASTRLPRGWHSMESRQSACSLR